MNKYALTFVISIITATIISSLLYSAGVSQKHVVIIAGASFVVNGLVFWLALEYIVLRDASKIKDSISHYLRGLKTEELPQTDFNLGVSNRIYKDLHALQKRTEKEIKRLNERADFRTQFIADISHELKTPIFAAQGYVHTLLDGAVDDDEVRYKFLKKSANSLDVLDNLVKDLLELSQIESGNVVLMNDHFDLVKLVDEIIDDFEQQAIKADISIKREKEPLASIVFADFVRTRQVIQNLVSNAIKYNLPKGEVRIKIVENNESVKVQISDTGIGIPNKDISQIFKRFYRVDKSRTKIKKKGSNGLGLAIVKHLLSIQNSTITVKSEVGKGSVFTFSLQKDKPPL
ncbi:MAG: cell wall metabolism sensor histidine kinase WalK [Cyclobacteriaceae bacterium]|nr:cell wall metabolism sensor histidine kinase WalK [Cyclobacteriaceae bacterium]